MKVAVVGTRNLPGNYGGVETACEHLYVTLAKLGVQVQVYCRSETFAITTHTHQGVQVLNFPVPELPGIATFLHCFIAAILASLSDAEIIHFHAQGPALFTFIPRLLAPQKKIVFTCHGIDWQRDRWGKIARAVIRQGERHSVRYTDQRIFVSQSLKDHYQGHYSTEGSVIPNGVNLPESCQTRALLEQFNLEPHQYLLFMGRLVPEKAPDILIEAFNRLNTNVKLVIAGDSPETPDYVVKLHQLAKGNPNIVFTSYLRGQQIAEAYTYAHTFILPSKLEGFPITALEAMSYGKALLLSNIGPHQEILDACEQALPTFAWGSVDACHQALEALLATSPETLQVIGEDARQAAQVHFSREANAQAVFQIYRDCIQSASKSHAVEAQAVPCEVH